MNTLDSFWVFHISSTVCMFSHHSNKHNVTIVLLKNFEGKTKITFSLEK